MGDYMAPLSSYCRHVGVFRMNWIGRIQRRAVKDVQRASRDVQVQKVHHHQVHRDHCVSVLVQFFRASLAKSFLAKYGEMRAEKDTRNADRHCHDAIPLDVEAIQTCD